MISESFLHYIWKTKNFNHGHMPYHILQYGFHNQSDGPDFNNAKIKIQGQVWHGHVEVHIKASDWYKHKHHNDPKYDNVILHVVWEDDMPVTRVDGSPITTLTLKNRVNSNLIEGFEYLIYNNSDIPCLQQSDHISIFNALFQWQKHHLVIEKTEQYNNQINDVYHSSQQDWNQVMWFMLARSMGLPKNKEAMEQLASKIQYKWILKERYDLEKLEALFLGTAGLLQPSSTNEPYFTRLQQHFSILKIKYSIVPMSGIEWRWLRLRPHAYVTIRLVLLAKLYATYPNFHNMLFTAQHISEITNLLRIQASTFWNTHYTFHKTSAINRIKILGPSTANSMLINGVIPLLFFYYQSKELYDKLEMVIDWLASMPDEKNKITKLFVKKGVKNEHALDSQSLLHLYKNYCVKKQCSNCKIGHQILKKISQKIEENKASYHTKPNPV